MSSLKVGVVGVGRMGQRHCRVYDNIRKVKLVGVSDTNPHLGSQIAQQYDAIYFRNYVDLLENVDVISIATPTQYHYEQTKLALERGVHILVEKPITENLEQAFEILNLVENKDVVFQVGHIERFNPAYIELKNVVENLTPIAINFYRLSPYKGSNKDVDVIQDLMIHDANLFYDLCNTEPKSINASGLIVFSGFIDHALVNIGFSNGPLVSLTASRVTEHKVRLIEVIAKEAYVRCDLLNKNISIRRSTIGEYLNGSQPGIKYHQESVVEWINVPTVEPLVLQQQHFVDCILNEETPLVSARDGYNAMKLVTEIRSLIEKAVGKLEDKVVNLV
mgnify:CR=1 FL=1